jgi:sulfate adenylyltransferase subunit 1
MDLLRFITAGSVDDGKSTLIGRLLYDSHAVSLDLLEAIQRQGKKNEHGEADLSLLTDGLRAEREQGITIDVAYKYFTTPKRKFIIADTPGHVQYTRNMVTGASNADLAIILIDARQGVVEQTRRHSYIAALLGIPQVIVCVNKMDMVNYSQEKYETIKADYIDIRKKLGLSHVTFIPVSALAGDNIVNKSEKMDWYEGDALMEILEKVPVRIENTLQNARFQVQYVIRPKNDDLHDYRGYAGKIQSGVYRKGDTVAVLPSGQTTQITAIERDMKAIDVAFAPMSVVIHLKDDIDISRGDSIVPVTEMPVVSQEIEANICWMSDKPLVKGQKLLLQHHSHSTKCVVRDIAHKTDIHTLEYVDSEDTLHLNEIGKITVKTARALAYDTYSQNRRTGAFILIDERTNNTVAAGMIA